MPSVLPRTSWLSLADLSQPPSMRGDGAREDAAQQHDDLADDEFGDAAGVGERRVEHRNAEPLGRVEIDLVGADAEAADGDQPVGRLEHLRR